MSYSASMLQRPATQLVDALPTILEGLTASGIARVPAGIPDILRRTALERLDLLDAAATAVAPGYEPELESVAGGRPRLRKLRRLAWVDPEFWQPWLHYTGYADFARTVLGPGATLVFFAAFLKPARTGSAIGFHQDQGLWSFEYPCALTIWTALQKADTRTGGLLGFAGSHSRGLLPHTAHLPNMAHPVIDPAGVRLGRPQSISAEAGDVLIWHRHFVHGSAPNQSDRDRRAVVAVFADSAQPGFQARDRLAVQEIMAGS
jgi:hypothetical protein